jgi:hydroxyethylthiazole kinase-like uncharacterized protein yjeF
MHPVKIISVGKSRSLEQAANQRGLSYAQMMDSAGRATAQAIQRWVTRQSPRVLVLVGPGNNGGDGLVAAHYLKEMGARVTCYVWKRDVENDGNYRRVEQEGSPVVWARDDAGHGALRGLLGISDVVLDALLGVGVSRPMTGSLAALTEVVRQMAGGSTTTGLVETVPSTISRSRPLVVAVDCPTGLDCDTGTLDPAALFADMTVTFAHPKAGLLKFPGAEAVGSLIVADIGIPAELAEDVWLEMATPAQICSWLPGRPLAAHKGSFGRALVVAGSVNFAGAAALAGQAATRVGAGLVTMALPVPIQPAVAAHLAEATYLLLPHDLGVIASDAVQVLLNHAGDYQALLLGPGITQEAEPVAFVHSLLGQHSPERKGRIGFVASSADDDQQRPTLPPLVLDADALNALSRVEGWWTALPSDSVVTPHPGEMARLMGSQTRVRDIQADREGVCRRMAQAWGAVVVLKGAFTVVAAPDGRAAVIPFANPGLATAGSGDVLAGAIAGLRAQGMGAFESAVTGAYAHGLAGELARADLGDMGMVAGDLPPRLPLALRRIRQTRWP